MNLDFNAGFIVEEEIQVLSVSKASAGAPKELRFLATRVCVRARVRVRVCVLLSSVSTAAQAPPHIARHFPKQQPLQTT